MGKKDKSKQKGKGAEKTQAKTEKKLSNKLKKTLKDLGEDDIESIVAQVELEEKKRLRVTECLVEAPSRRINFSFISHPDKDQLILFGGEYFNGQKTFIYNDLLFYSISNNTWNLVKAPGAPPPRCGHQMIASSANKGELWVFGGEFASPNQSQFYHYKDLWVYHIVNKQWEKIAASGGPSARSGHRMILIKKQLFVFGGFHDNLREYKYFNDLYCFDLETYKWKKIEAVGTPPAPRSACCMVPLQDGKILIYGGYSKEKLKKDVDKGQVYTDAFILKLDKNNTLEPKYKWQQIKLGGFSFSPRCSMPITTVGQSYAFGGVFDVEDDEENLSGTFFNDFLQLDLEKLVWRQVELCGKKDLLKSRRRKLQENEESGNDEEEEIAATVEIAETTRVVADDGIFKVTVGPSSNCSKIGDNSSPLEHEQIQEFQPSPRMNCGLAVKHGILYLYGGMFEDGQRELTFSDFYSIDLKKLDEWKTIIADDYSKVEWLGSDSESSDSEDAEENDDEESDENSSDVDD